MVLAAVVHLAGGVDCDADIYSCVDTSRGGSCYQDVVRSRCTAISLFAAAAAWHSGEDSPLPVAELQEAGRGAAGEVQACITSSTACASGGGSFPDVVARANILALGT